MTMEDLCKAYAQKRAGAIAAGAALEPQPANRAPDGKQVRLVRRAECTRLPFSWNFIKQHLAWLYLLMQSARFDVLHQT